MFSSSLFSPFAFRIVLIISQNFILILAFRKQLIDSFSIKQGKVTLSQFEDKSKRPSTIRGECWKIVSALVNCNRLIDG